MKTAAKMSVLAAAALVALILGVGVGSVFIPPDEVCAILVHFLFGMPICRRKSGRRALPI